MKIARLVVVNSTRFWKKKSLRVKKGDAYANDVYNAITAAGFDHNEEVVLIGAKDLEMLMEHAIDCGYKGCP